MHILTHVYTYTYKWKKLTNLLVQHLSNYQLGEHLIICTKKWLCFIYVCKLSIWWHKPNAIELERTEVSYSSYQHIAVNSQSVSQSVNQSISQSVSTDRQQSTQGKISWGEAPLRRFKALFSVPELLGVCCQISFWCDWPLWCVSFWALPSIRCCPWGQRAPPPADAPGRPEAEAEAGGWGHWLPTLELHTRKTFNCLITRVNRSQSVQ